MEKELFGAIRDNYYLAGKSLWSWLKNRHIILQIIFFLWVLIASLAMYGIGFIFSLGVVLDKFSVFILEKRDLSIDFISKSTDKLYYSKTAYFLTPILAILISPICFILGIIPKWSSTILSTADAEFETSYEKEFGFFKRLGNSYLNLVAHLFKNLNSHGYLFAILALITTLLSSPILILIGLFFYIFIILDYVGWIVSIMRQFVVDSSYKFARNIGTSSVNSFLMPVLLVIFVPVYIVLLLVPKIASYDADI